MATDLSLARRGKGESKNAAPISLGPARKEGTKRKERTGLVDPAEQALDLSLILQRWMGSQGDFELLLRALLIAFL